MFAVENLQSTMEVREVNSSLTSFYVRFLGSYFFNKDFDLSLKRIFLKADKTKNLIISYITEVNLFITQPTDKYTLHWFEYLHSLSSLTGLPLDKITFLISNIHAKESYYKWCVANNLKPSINIIEQPNFYWISRVIELGYNSLPDVEPVKHFSCFVGRPRLQKNNIVKWYINKIVSTEQHHKMICTFLYKNITDMDNWFVLNKDKISSLPGKIEDSTKDHENAFLNGDPIKFNSAALSALVDFIVDFVEEEDFSSIEQYNNFKYKNPWWSEDTISEKTFKSILLKKPFIRLGRHHSLKKLKDWGFQTFNNVLFDESYDDIENLTERTNFILDQVEKKIILDFDDFKKQVFSKEVTDIVEHNYNLAYEIFNNRKDIVNV